MLRKQRQQSVQCSNLGSVQGHQRCNGQCCRGGGSSNPSQCKGCCTNPTVFGRNGASTACNTHVCRQCCSTRLCKWNHQANEEWNLLMEGSGGSKTGKLCCNSMLSGMQEHTIWQIIPQNIILLNTTNWSGPFICTKMGNHQPPWQSVKQSSHPRNRQNKLSLQ